MARLVAAGLETGFICIVGFSSIGRDEWSDQDVTRARDGDNVRTRDTEIVTRV